MDKDNPVVDENERKQEALKDMIQVNLQLSSFRPRSHDTGRQSLKTVWNSYI